MDSYELLHTQMIIALMQGFLQPPGGGHLFLDISNGELIQKDLRGMDGIARFQTDEADDYLMSQESKQVPGLLARIRDGSRQALPELAFSRSELVALRMFLRYMLMRTEAICLHAEKQQVHTGFNPQVLSTGHVLNMPVSQMTSPEEYYPVLYIDKSNTDFVTSYTSVYTTRVVFDSVCYALPVSFNCTLLFVHSSLHKFFYKSGILKSQYSESRKDIQRLNDDAFQSELLSGARYMAGSASELKRLKKSIAPSYTSMSQVEESVPG